MDDMLLQAVLRFRTEGQAAFSSAQAQIAQTEKSSGSLAGSLKGLAVAAAGMFAGFEASKILTDTISSTQALGESVRKLSMQTGLSAEQSSHYIFMLHETGLAADNAEKAFGIFAKGVDMHSKTVTGALAQLGVSATDSFGHFKSVNDLIPEISDRYRLLDDGLKKLAIAQELFGKSGKEMIPFLDLGSKAMADMAAEADKLGVTLSADNVAKIHEYTVAQREMSAAAEGVKVQIGLALIPALTEASQGVTHFLERNKEAIDNFANGIPGAIEVTTTSVKTFAQGTEALAQGIGHIIGLSDDLAAAMVPLGIAMAFLFPEGALVLGIAAVHESFTIMDSDASKLSDSALTFDIAWMKAISHVLKGLDDLEQSILNNVPILHELNAMGWLGDTAALKAKRAVDATTRGLEADQISRGGLDIGLAQKLSSDPGAIDAFKQWTTATERAKQPLLDLAVGVGAAVGGLTAAEKLAQQGLIDMALAFADFTAQTGLGVEAFMAVLKVTEDKAALDKRITDLTIAQNVAFMEAADSGYQFRLGLVAIGEQLLKTGETITEFLRDVSQKATDALRAASSAIFSRPTRESAGLQLSIDQLQRERDVAAFRGANDATLKQFDLRLKRLQDEQRIREDAIKIMQDQNLLADQTLLTDRQQKDASVLYTIALSSQTMALQNLASQAALEGIARQNLIDAMNNQAAALGGSGGFNAAQMHWINGVANTRGETAPFPGFAGGIDYVPRDMLAMVHRGEAVIPAGGRASTIIFNPSVEVHVAGDATDATVERIKREMREELDDLMHDADQRGWFGGSGGGRPL